MNIQEILFTLSMFGVLQGILLSLSIFQNAKLPRISRHLLTITFLIWSVAMLLITLVNSGVLSHAPIFEIVEYTLGFLAGPLLFLYLQHRRQEHSRLTFPQLLHFVPALLFLGDALVQIIQFKNLNFSVLWLMLHLQFYLWASVFSYFRQPDKTKNDWAKLLLILMAIVSGSQWIRFYFSDNHLFDLIIPAVVSVSFYGITLAGFYRSSLFEFGFKDSLKISKSIQNQDVTAHLKALMTQEKLYEHADLSLYQVAQALHIHPNQLSALLNQQLEQNFRDYINTYRIEAAKKLLVSPDSSHWTIEAIAGEVGFNSRSTFYQAFKNKEGCTPNQFRKRQISA